MKLVPFLLIATAVAVPAVLFAQAPSNKSCLSYWSVGDSACDGEPQQEQDVPRSSLAASPLPPRQLAVPQPPVPHPSAPVQSLDKRVDGYLKDYGKPPREFVAFNLEPTIENAMRWVRKYEEMLKRERDVANSWEQASVIYGQMTPDERAEILGEDPNEPSVPSFDEVELSSGRVFTANVNTQNEVEIEAEEQQASVQKLKRVNSVGPGGRLTSATAEILEVSYYYSGECQACAKFESNLRDALLGYVGQVELQCIDTAGGNQASALQTRLDCEPRPALPGELSFLKIKAVPSAVISAPSKEEPTVLRGYATYERLQKVLKDEIKELYR
jgi:hypothetical protein